MGKISEETKNLLESIEELALNSSKIPILNRLLIDEDKLFSLLDALSKTLPEEMNYAKEIVLNKEKILLDANQRANELLENAQARARLMTSEHEVIKNAQKVADELIRKANEEANELTLKSRSEYETIIKKAQEEALILSTRSKNEYETAIKKAREDASALAVKSKADYEEAIKKTREEVEIIKKEANFQADKTKEEADKYADSVLAKLEDKVSSAINVVKNGREKIAQLI